MLALTEGSAPPAEISIMDDASGVTYTLYPQLQEVRSSDGHVVRLDGELTAVALTEFQGTIDTDPMVADLAIVGSSGGGCSPSDPNNPCDELRADGPVDARRRVRARRSSVIWQRLGSRITDPATRRPPRKPRGGNDKLWGSFEGGAKTSTGTLAQTGYYFSCQDVAVNVSNAIYQYQNQRTSFIRDLFGLAIEEVISTVSSAGQGFINVAADHMNARINVAVHGWFWNTLGCNTQQVRAGPVIRRGASGGNVPPDWVLVCHYVYYTISFNGGQTYDTFSVKECAYEPA